ILFLTHDYRFGYVWKTSNNEMHPLYLISAVWGGMDGSMLLWAVVTSIYGIFCVRSLRFAQQTFRSATYAFFHAGTLFFYSVVCFFTNPFRLLPTEQIPSDGSGLNPLLQNPSMLIHPPCLYLGFTGLLVPAALMCGALMTRSLTADWLASLRRATLIPWAFLTCGIILGGHWAYIELGWGGFWAWDPVENASFLPWLTSTALIHSIMVQERRGILKFWNALLAFLSYGLCVFGTFLTRSGVVQSVHAFAETDVGWVFLSYLAIYTLSIALICFARWEQFAAENPIETFYSREAVFLINNLLLVSICFATCWGVLFPVISEAVVGEKSVVGPPFFNQVNSPLFLCLLFLMGTGPLLAWRRTSLSKLKSLLAFPLLVGSAATVTLFIIDLSRPLAALSFGILLMGMTTILAEFRRGLRVQNEILPNMKRLSLAAIWRLIRQKPRRYCGYLVHAGIYVMALGIIASSVYKIERDVSLVPGEAVEIGRYRIELANLREQSFPNYQALIAEVKVLDRNNSLIQILFPEQRFYPRGEQVTSEVAVHSTLLEDVYLALGGLDNSSSESRAAFKIFLNPLQVWLWIGAGVLFCGIFLLIVLTRLEPVAVVAGGSARVVSPVSGRQHA
ncbi:heme lyase CcmF/NrfE family subunit, partial [bacterium]|nr:heme lyase CcmF/NrfE family subunit [bacterium]